jgi:uncharacterized protein YgiB involved in biofilm formation
MKRSRHIALLSMGVSTLVLTACGGDKVDTSAYSSVADCTSAKVLTESQCMRAFELAVDEHEATAPRFSSKAQCEQIAGESKCERSASSGTSNQPTYRPSFVSFLVPHLFTPSSGQVQPLYPQKAASNLVPAATVVDKARTAGLHTTSPRVATLSRNGFGTTTSRAKWFSTSSS